MAAEQFARLALVHEQLAHAFRLVIETAGLGVFGDIGVDEEELAILGVGIGLSDRGLAGAQRLHLGARQHDAGLQACRSIA